MLNQEALDEIEYHKAMATSLTIAKTEKPNSYEFGSAGNRFKLYFETADDLLIQVKKLRELGFNIEITAGL